MMELLQARGRIGGPELARRLEVGERTVRRYAAMLREMGVPVEAEVGRHGGYRLRPGRKLPPMVFTEEEALGLALGLLAARGLGLSGVAPAVEGALAKLERVMPEPLSGRVGALEGAVSIAVGRPGRGTPASSEALLTLAAAVGEGRRVRVVYTSEWSGKTERAVDPYGVVHREGYWYAAGHCHLRGGLRLFRVDRILEAEILADTFERPARFESPEALMSAAANAPGGEWSVEVLLETTVEEAGRWLPDMGLALEEAEGGTVLRCRTWDLGWVARMLAGLNCPFVVRHPAELREALEERATEIAALVRRPESEAPLSQNTLRIEPAEGQELPRDAGDQRSPGRGRPAGSGSVGEHEGDGEREEQDAGDEES
jgi:predicted DNA-binding transcriptional regulator YafY